MKGKKALNSTTSDKPRIQVSWKRFFIFGSCLLLFVSITSRLWSAPAGDAGTSWLKIPNSARSAGMAGAFCSVADDINALGVNPAGLALLGDRQAAFMHNIWVRDVSTEHLAYGQNFSDDSGGAVGLDYVNFGSVDQYILGPGGAPVQVGTYSPMGGNAYFGYGRKVAPGLFAGATAKFLLQSLDSQTTGFTVAGDLGLLLRLPKTGASFALVLSDLGGNLSTAALPLRLQLGASYQTDIGKPVEGVPGHFIIVSADGDISLARSGSSSFSLGSEYWYNRQVAVRAGYRFASFGALEGLRGFCAGVSVRYQKFELSYALTTLGDIGNGHQLSLVTRF